MNTVRSWIFRLWQTNLQLSCILTFPNLQRLLNDCIASPFHGVITVAFERRSSAMHGPTPDAHGRAWADRKTAETGFLSWRRSSSLIGTTRSDAPAGWLKAEIVADSAVGRTVAAG